MVSVRSLAVLVFIGGVGATAAYVAQRPTIARGDVIGADLVAANPAKLRAVTCDDQIEVGVEGAVFGCRAEFRDGSIERLRFKMSRTGAIQQTGVESYERRLFPLASEPAEPAEPKPPARDKGNSADPWGD